MKTHEIPYPELILKFRLLRVDSWKFKVFRLKFGFRFAFFRVLFWYKCLASRKHCVFDVLEFSLGEISTKCPTCVPEVSQDFFSLAFFVRFLLKAGGFRGGTKGQKRRYGVFPPMFVKIEPQ